MELFIEITEESVHFNAKFAGYDAELSKEFAEDKILKFKNLVGTLPEFRLPSLCSDYFTARIQNVTLPNFDARKKEIIDYFKKGVRVEEIHKKMKIDEELVKIEIKQIIKGSFDPFYDIFAEFPKLI
jgi:DNA-binding NarL/FixJ family response regulator